MNHENNIININQLQRSSDNPTKLSDSPIWKIQKSYYKNQGIDAWLPNAVPSYVTTNSFTASAYAKVISGFFMDYRAKHSYLTGNTTHYIIELGSGAGSFAHRFLTYFFSETEVAARNDIDIVYVMTDISEANIQFWREHPQLRTFVDAGQLDFAYLDIIESNEIKLLVSGRTITEKSLDTPLAVIANYVVDSIPHDLFSVKNGQLHERLVTHNVLTGSSAIDQIVRQTEFNYCEQECSTNYYANKYWNDILSEYCQDQSDLEFSFPVGGLQTLDKLRYFTSQPTFFLSSDFGDSALMPLRELGPRKVARNGTYSLHVNYHAITRYAEMTGAEVFQTEHSHSSLATIGVLLQTENEKPNQLSSQFDRHIRMFGPDEFFMLKKIAEKCFDDLNINQVLALIRISQWDSKIFLGCYNALINACNTPSPWLRQTLLETFEKVDAMHFRYNGVRDPSEAIDHLREKLEEKIMDEA